jgi:hypothetical protein
MSGINKSYETAKIRDDRCLAILWGGRRKLSDGPLLQSLSDLRERMCALMPRAWMTCFVRSASAYFESSGGKRKTARGIPGRSPTVTFACGRTPVVSIRISSSSS